MTYRDFLEVLAQAKNLDEEIRIENCTYVEELEDFSFSLGISINGDKIAKFQVYADF